MANNFDYCAERAKFQERAIQLGHWQCCSNCEHWKRAECSLYQTVPPVNVLLVGCSSWMLDIPF